MPAVPDAIPPASPPPSEAPAALRVGPHGRITVAGRVVDEAGAPIAAATVTVSSEEYVRDPVVTDADGRFETTVPPTSALRLAASHADYGEQWTDMQWRGWSRYDAITAEPVVLTLRRGVVLRGELLGADGAPRAHERLLLVPAYVGSGPRPLETTTDDAGQFTFPRAVLDRFELVARSLDDWHPERGNHPGDYVRIAAHDAEWLAHARADEPITALVEPFTLVAVTLRLTRPSGAPLRRVNVDVWLRTSETSYLGTMPRTSAEGTCRVLMERGVTYELWAALDHGEREAPWTHATPPSWRGSVERPREIAITIE